MIKVAATGLTNHNITSLAVSGGDLYAGTEGRGVFVSTNMGASWNPPADSITYLWITSLVVSGDKVIAGESIGGVWMASNGGAIWSSMNTGLTDLSVWSLLVSDSAIYVGTSQSGLWNRPAAEFVTSVGNGRAGFPSPTTLEQNYPNPFNPSTSIRYILAERSHVTLSVYSTVGQLVSTLVNGEEGPGYHEVKFDGSKLASGTYLYRIQAGAYAKTLKFLIVR